MLHSISIAKLLIIIFFEDPATGLKRSTLILLSSASIIAQTSDFYNYGKGKTGRRFPPVPVHNMQLFELALASSLRFLFALDRRLLVVLSFTELSENAGAGTGAFKSTQRAVQRLIVFNSDF